MKDQTSIESSQDLQHNLPQIDLLNSKSESNNKIIDDTNNNVGTYILNPKLKADEIIMIDHRRRRALQGLKVKSIIDTILHFLESSEKLVVCNVSRFFRFAIENLNKDNQVDNFKQVFLKVNTQFAMMNSKIT